MKEEWKDLVYYYTTGKVIKTDKYEVSNTGKIRHKKKQRLIAFSIDRYGYYRCGIYNIDGKRYNLLVHRVIASTFIPTDDYSLTVNHIDGSNKFNNNVKNLEWLSLQDNINEAYNTGLRTKHGERPVDQLNKDTLEIIKTYPSVIEAQRQTGISNQHIGMVCLNKRKTAGGYIWRYHEAE